MPDQVMTSFALPNYSGMLFNKGNTRAPFSTLIANNVKTTNHVEFVTGQEFETGGGAQPAISETASLTAPEATFINREQKRNVTQIFHEALYISYGKQSNMGTLGGINIAGQQPEPVGELDFQTDARMRKIERDIEFTFIQGSYNKAANDSQANKTRGMNEAITSNVLSLDGKPLRVWDVADAMRMVAESNAPLAELVLWLDAVSMFQLHADAEANGLTIVPAGRDLNGIQLSRILTPLGEISLYLGEFIPAGTVFLFNPTVVGRVEQPTPGKGNFFLEELAKTGAGTKYQIFGQLGLDHGPEWYHAKISGINTNFVKPKAGKKIYADTPIPTAAVLPELAAVALTGPAIVGDATDALAVSYVGTPLSAPTLAYQWQVGDTAVGLFSAIGGATSATYSPVEGNVGKYIRCVVTASGTAFGTVISNAVLVNAE